MRAFHLTFLPMLAIAILTFIVGERLARRQVEEHIPLDREKVLDFTMGFELEIERLDALYRGHLKRLTESDLKIITDDLKVGMKSIAAIKAVHLFSEDEMMDSYKLLAPSHADPIPDVSLESLPEPFGLSGAVIIPTETAITMEVGEYRWLQAPDGKHLVYWTRSHSKRFVAVVVHKGELNTINTEYIVNWMVAPLTPLRESSIHFSITSPIGELTHEGEQETQGGAALIMPKRSHSGTWQIQAWDGISKSSHHDAIVIAVTLIIAVVFLLIGFLLYQQQMRSLKLAKQRVSFVNQVSHELGSPLTNISLNLDLAREALDLPTDGQKKAKHRLGLVNQEIDRLNRLVSNVLTFSQSDRGVLEINKEICLTDEVIEQLLDSYRPALKRRGIELEYEQNINSQVLTDPDALIQIISNLISNVEKYAYSGKWLSVKTFLRDEDFVISVSDRGPGIPEGARKRVFKSFERLQNKLNEGSSGAGLGLSIASELANKLGGVLEMVSCEVGCHFELSLPVNGTAKEMRCE